MKLKNQVCSREPAQEMKKLGIKQKSLFWWHRVMGGWVVDNKPPKFNKTIAKNWSHEALESLYCSAFTVAELGEMLPKTIQCKAMFGGDVEGHIKYHYYKDVENKPHYEIKYVVYGYEEYHYISPWINESSEANARAKMLIHLAENKPRKEPKVDPDRFKKFRDSIKPKKHML